LPISKIQRDSLPTSEFLNNCKPANLKSRHFPIKDRGIKHEQVRKKVNEKVAPKVNPAVKGLPFDDGSNINKKNKISFSISFF